jgi:hypothetical protein
MTRRTVLRWLIAAFLAVQLTLPILALAGPRPTGFGWQMFTAYAPPPTVSIEMADGSVVPIELADLLAHPRPEADLHTPIVADLCEREDVVAVILTAVGGDRRVACP